MTKIIIKTLTVFCLFILIASCDRPECKNTNPIFDKYSPDSKEYKDELINQLAKINKSKLTYWFDTYQEKNSSQFIHALVQGEGICAKIILNLNGRVKGIEGIIKSKGKGYRGSELKDLTFDIKQERLSTEFIFQEVSRIVD